MEAAAGAPGAGSARLGRTCSRRPCTTAVSPMDGTHKYTISDDSLDHAEVPNVTETGEREAI